MPTGSTTAHSCSESNRRVDQLDQQRLVFVVGHPKGFAEPLYVGWRERLAREAQKTRGGECEATWRRLTAGGSQAKDCRLESSRKFKDELLSLGFDYDAKRRLPAWQGNSN